MGRYYRELKKNIWGLWKMEELVEIREWKEVYDL